MIHAFLVAIGILAAISLFPFIALFTGIILTSVTFWVWVVACYLFTLGLEITLVLAGKPAAPAAPTAVRRTDGGG